MTLHIDNTVSIGVVLLATLIGMSTICGIVGVKDPSEHPPTSPWTPTDPSETPRDPSEALIDPSEIINVMPVDPTEVDPSECS